MASFVDGQRAGVASEGHGSEEGETRCTPEHRQQERGGAGRGEGEHDATTPKGEDVRIARTPEGTGMTMPFYEKNDPGEAF